VVAVAEDQGEPRRRALARRALGSTLFYFGRFEAAAEQLFEGIAIDQAAEGSDDDPAFLALYAERAGVVCRTNLAMSLWYLGYPDQALRGRARLGRSTGPRPQRRLCQGPGGDDPQLPARLHRSCQLGGRNGRGVARTRTSPVARHGGDVSGVRAGGAWQVAPRTGTDSRGLLAWHAIGTALLDTQWLGYIAAAHLQAGELDQALAALDEAAAVAATSQTFCQAELLRLRG